MRGREAWRWMVASLPLAPLAACVYLLLEWLFFITKPSPIAALPFSQQLAILLKAPLPLILPLLAVQMVASLVSIVNYPRLRFLALAPASVVGGVLLLVLMDNFTYTLFSVGVLTGGEAFRIGYSALLAVLVAVAGREIASVFGAVYRRRGAVAVGLVAAVFLASAPGLAARRPPRAPDPHLLPATSGTGKGSGDLPNIFFLGFDGIEADILSAYGYKRQTTPFLDRIKDETLFFENAFSNATRTHGSLVTLLTGRLPFSTRVTFPPTVLQGEDAHRHLPGLLKQLGYTTFQVGIRHYADAEDANLLGFDAANYRWQGVDLRPRAPVSDETAAFRRVVAERLDERLGRLFGLAPVASGFAHVEGRQIAPELRDDRRVATLQEYFRRAPEPWFVHLHMADTHCCQYRPQQMHFSGSRTTAVDARDSQLLETDGHIQKLFDALQTSGRLDRTVVVISSDHTSQWKTTERVPLMMRFPGARLKGRVSANVQLADVAPTMLGYLGLEPPPWMDGLSLVEPSKIPAERPIFGVSDIGRREGVPGLRLLLDSGPPNYGATSAMMIAGSRWYELSLRDGMLTSGPVPGHSAAGVPVVPVVPDAEARRLIEARLTAGGFRVNSSQSADFR